ncbi:hypothetical protein AX14_009961, partial [Amanita brunnescens Koide BX004]
MPSERQEGTGVWDRTPRRSKSRRADAKEEGSTRALCVLEPRLDSWVKQPTHRPPPATSATGTTRQQDPPPEQNSRDAIRPWGLSNKSPI